MPSCRYVSLVFIQSAVYLVLPHMLLTLRLRLCLHPCLCLCLLPHLHLCLHLYLCFPSLCAGLDIVILPYIFTLPGGPSISIGSGTHDVVRVRQRLSVYIHIGHCISEMIFITVWHSFCAFLYQAMVAPITFSTFWSRFVKISDITAGSTFGKSCPAFSKIQSLNLPAVILAAGQASVAVVAFQLNAS